MPINSKGRVFQAAKVAFAVAVVVAVTFALISQWGALEAAAASARPRWGYITLSCLLVLANYAILIQAWRVVLAGWGGELGFRESARIWTISNLGRYIPGKVWQIGTLAVMVQERGVSSVAAVGAALIVTLVNTVAGFVVLAATGAGVLNVPPAGIVAIAALGGAILLAPSFLPWLGRLVAKVTHRDFVIPRIPHSAIWLAAAISVASWVLYGLAFESLATGVLGRTPGSPALYIAIFSGSYLAGFLALIVPGGVGVREVVMATALRGAGFETGEAILLVVASRVWLTVLEILPATFFLIAQYARREPREARGDVR